MKSSHDDGKGASQRSCSAEALPETKAARGRASSSWAAIWDERAAKLFHGPRKVTVDTKEALGCAKDPNHKGPFYRHHKGFDSYVGIWNKGILLAYYKYRDCVRLCEDCHCTIHYLYEPYVEKWFNRTAKGALAFRKRLIDLCDEWLEGKIKTPVVPKSYRAQFRGSLLKWKRSRKM